MALQPYDLFPLFAGVALLGGAVIARFLFSQNAVALRRMRKASRSAIGDVKPGTRVRIEGCVRYAGHTISAPLNDRPCASYRVSVEEKVFRGRGVGWDRIAAEDKTVDFFVEDESGRAMVRVAECVVVLERDTYWLSSQSFEPDEHPRLAALLAETTHSGGSTGFRTFGPAGRELRYEERVLEEGDQVAVWGIAHWEDDPVVVTPQPYRQRSQRLVLQAQPGNVLVVADRSLV